MLSLLVCCLHGIAALNPIVVKGNKLYDSVTKERFMMRGVAYAPDKYFNPEAGGDRSLVPDGKDLLDDDHESWWSRDISFLRAAHVNVIRIYEIDPFKSHAKIMKALDDAGIYVIVGLTKSAPDVALPAGTPSPGCFRSSMMDSVERIILNMGIYSNLLAFVVGNEVSNAVQVEGISGHPIRGYLAMPCVKALTRDARKFMKSCPGLRSVPLMYAATDFANPPKQIVADYLMCNQTEDGGAVDIYGINVYTWCAKSATLYTQSTYGLLLNQFRRHNVPFVLSEFGCNKQDFDSTWAHNWTKQRTWKSAGPAGLFHTDMKEVFSGGLAYQYSMTANEYGLVLLPGYQANQPDIIALPNYYNLQNQFAQDMVLQDQWKAAEMGMWTTNNECTWVADTDRAAPACPSLTAIGQMFDEIFQGTNATTITHPPSLWYDPLPTLKRTPLPCVVGAGPIPRKCDLVPALPPTAPTAPPPTAPTNAPTPGKCDQIQKLPGCTTDLATLNGTQIGKLFDNLCTKFNNEYVVDPLWCTHQISDDQGVFKACTPQQKIDLALYEWAQWAPECCVPLKDNQPCTEYSSSVSEAPTSGVTVAPTSGAVPTPSNASAPTSVPAPTDTAPTNSVPTNAAPTNAAPSSGPPSASAPSASQPTTPNLPTPAGQSPTTAAGEVQAVGDNSSGSGLAVGIGLTVAILVLALGFFLYRRVKARRAHGAENMLPLIDTLQ